MRTEGVAIDFGFPANKAFDEDEENFRIFRERTKCKQMQNEIECFSLGYKRFCL